MDIALWDIAGKARGVPIYELLGGAVQNEVMVYASTSRADRRSMSVPRDEWRRKTTEEMVLECREYVEQGFKAIKFGWGQHFGPEAQDSLAAMREAIGPDVRLMLDCGPGTYLDGAWTVKESIRVSKLLERHDIYFMEEPLHPYDVEGFRELTLNAPIKIATGESLTAVRDFQRFIDRSAIDVAQPDIQQMGMSQFIRVAQATEMAGMLCIPPRAVECHTRRRSPQRARNHHQRSHDRVPGFRLLRRGDRHAGQDGSVQHVDHRDSAGSRKRLPAAPYFARTGAGELRPRSHRRAEILSQGEPVR